MASSTKRPLAQPYDKSKTIAAYIHVPPWRNESASFFSHTPSWRYSAHAGKNGVRRDLGNCKRRLDSIRSGIRCAALFGLSDIPLLRENKRNFDIIYHWGYSLSYEQRRRGSFQWRVPAWSRGRVLITVSARKGHRTLIVIFKQRPRKNNIKSINRSIVVWNKL